MENMRFQSLVFPTHTSWSVHVIDWDILHSFGQLNADPQLVALFEEAKEV